MTSAEKIKELEGEMFLINHELNKWKDQDKALRETINNDEKIISELQDQMKLRRDLVSSILTILRLSTQRLGQPTMESFYIPTEAFTLIDTYLRRIEDLYYIIPTTSKSKKDTQ
jgi:hypothetical protein